MPAKVLVVGSANMDLIVRAPRIPSPGETVLGGEFHTARGGKGANQAVACARLGAETCFVGRVGQDAFGDQLAQGLADDGVDCRFLRRDSEAPTGVAMIVIDQAGENSIVVAPGANSRVAPLDLPRDLSGFHVLLCQLEVPVATVAAAARAAREAGLITVLDAGPPNEKARDILGLFDVVSPNETEARLLLGLSEGDQFDPEDAARKLLEMGPCSVVLKLGAEGALAVDESGDFHRVPAFKVQPVDTTGAGDAFTAALAVALGEGRTLGDATRMACAAGAIATTKLGAAPSMPTRAEVEQLLAQAGQPGAE